MTNELEKVGRPLGDGERAGFDLYKVWKDYEKIAMHFNDLLLKIRTQSLAAVAAFATIAGVLLKGESISHELRWGTLTAVFIALCVFWLAIWILDFTYYNRLLLGAVKALVMIERESKSSNRTSSIYISTCIEQAVALRDPKDQAASLADAADRAAVLADPALPEGFELSKGRWTFYSLVFALLVSLMVASIIQYRSPDISNPSAAMRQIPNGSK
jgi:hypothetical protein